MIQVWAAAVQSLLTFWNLRLDGSDFIIRAACISTPRRSTPSEGWFNREKRLVGGVEVAAADRGSVGSGRAVRGINDVTQRRICSPVSFIRKEKEDVLCKGVPRNVVRVVF